MGDNPPDWIRWVPSRWLSGVLGLSNEQRGVYIQVINVYYDRGSCPADFGFLAQVCKLRRDRVQRVIGELEALGKVQTIGAQLLPNRCEMELERAKNASLVARSSVNNRYKSKELGATIEKNQDKTQESERESPDSLLSARADDGDLVTAMIGVWSDELQGILAMPRKLDQRRRGKLLGRLRQDFGGSLEQWRAYCCRIRGSPHLTGDNDRGWKADLDWCLEPSHVNRILEGRYDKRKGNGNGRHESSETRDQRIAERLQSRLYGDRVVRLHPEDGEPHAQAQASSGEPGPGDRGVRRQDH